VNTVTPRVFVAATEQNTGKTTTSLGLYGALRARFPRIGFIKPVGQRFIEVEGKRIDEDSVLIRHTFDTQTPIEDMSPIAVEPDFTRRYIERSNSEHLVKRIQHSFDRACWEKDFAIIEGTGHAGVGAVFDLSNAKVASVLQSKVILVTPGGIGRPIDEAALNKALFDKEGVEVIGVVMNKVLPSKMDYISEFARRGFERLGIDLLGVIPQERVLSEPTVLDVCNIIRGEVISHPDLLRRHISNVMIGAMQPTNLLTRLESRTLLIVPGDREDIILAAHSEAECQPEGGGGKSCRSRALGIPAPARSRCGNPPSLAVAGDRLADGQLHHRQPDSFHDGKDASWRRGENPAHSGSRERAHGHRAHSCEDRRGLKIRPGSHANFH